MKQIYHDDIHGNTAILEEVFIYPYKGASSKQRSYRVTYTAEYNSYFVYRVVVFETLKAAIGDLINCGFEIVAEN